MIKAPKITNSINMIYEEILLHKSRSVCFTCSTAKEGTTTIACATAAAAALQQKVLYCDFTNHASSLSKKLNKQFKEMEGTPLEQLFNNIYPIEKYHFDLLPLPTVLVPMLMHEDFLKDLLRQLNQQYDLVIIDTNGFQRYKGSSLPTSGVCSATDATIIIALTGQVLEAELQQTAESIIEGGGKLVGIVMNDVYYPKLVNELCRITHYFDRFFPKLAAKTRKWLKKSIVFSAEN